MKLIPANSNVPPHPLYFLVFAVSSTVFVLRWAETFSTPRLRPIQPLVESLLRAKNQSCLIDLKQLYHELDSRTKVRCGLDKITDNAMCLQWKTNNTLIYSNVGSHERLDNCNAYFDTFPTTAFKKISRKERQTPLAFSIIAHNQFALLETVIASLFRPHNSYCIFVDAKADKKMHELVHKLVACYKSKFPTANIFVAKDLHPIFWAHFSMLMADLKCMNQLLKSDTSRLYQWQYFINQPGTALPTIKVDEIAAKIDKHKGRCDALVRTTEKVCPMDSVYSIRNVSLDNRFKYKFSISKSDNPFEFYPEIARRTSKRLSKPPPHNLTIFKGHKDIALTRTSAEFFLQSQPGKDLLKWLKSGVGFPEEFFFATLVRVSQKIYYERGVVMQNLDENFDSTGDLCFRFSLWHPRKHNQLCTGKEIRYMCHFGLGDLPKVFFNQSCTFANKFDLHVPNGPDAVACVHAHLTS